LAAEISAEYAGLSYRNHSRFAGPSNTITCAESAGLLAIGEAAQIIARGDAELALAGGGESKVNPIVHMRQSLLKRANDDSNDNPTEACRPFDQNAHGCIFGEAAGCVVLEDSDRAKNRSAKIYAQIAGIGQSCSLSTKYEALESDGKGVQYAIEAALAEARLSLNKLI
jgi:3-oxoacyl-[acyl-carrier-protein] synthase II